MLLSVETRGKVRSQSERCIGNLSVQRWDITSALILLQSNNRIIDILLFKPGLFPSDALHL